MSKRPLEKLQEEILTNIQAMVGGGLGYEELINSIMIGIEDCAKDLYKQMEEKKTFLP